jgi:hypothetical protein
MCFQSEPSIRDFPKGKEKSIQNIAGAWQDISGYDRYIVAYDKYMKGTYLVYSELCFITFESSIQCSLHVLCMLAYSNIRKWSPSMKTWWWNYAYVPVIYHHIPAYTVIWRYMTVYVGISGCQDSRCWQAAGTQPVTAPSRTRSWHSGWPGPAGAAQAGQPDSEARARVGCRPGARAPAEHIMMHLEPCAIWYHVWYHVIMILPMISYVSNCLWYRRPMIS